MRCSEIIHKHKAIWYIVVILISIAIARLTVLFYDPTPVILGFEIHHFDYGLIILLIITSMMLLKKKISSLDITISAIAMGMILDEVGFLRLNLLENVMVYGQTLSTTIITAIIFLVAILLLIKLFNKNKDES